VFRLEKTQSFGSLEGALKSFLPNREKVIQIPGTLDRAGMFGIDAASCQFLLTLVEEQPDLALRLSVGGLDSSAHLESLARHLFGFAAICCFDKIVDAQSKPVSNTIIRGCIDGWVTRMDSGKLGEIIRGRSVTLACVSNGPREFIRPLYALEENRGLQPCTAFQSFTRDMLSKCGASDVLTIREVDALGELLFELFRNTDEHASLDERGNQKSEPRFRAISASYREMQITDTTSYFGGDLTLQSYIGKLVASSKGAQKLKFFELSVVDNGPGLAARWIADKGTKEGTSIVDVTIDEELNAVYECFEKYNTTKTDAGAGQGLTKVVNRLSSLNAFMRLRTGRLALYQTFSSKDIVTGKVAFRPVQINAQRALKRATGTCYTICIPLMVGDANGR